jgi:type I restriction enzyme M protein
MNTSALVQKVWNFCHTLRDDGVGYGDYLEQLTYLLFLKLAHEYAQEPYHRDTHIPRGHDWSSLTARVGEPLEAHYLATLHRLGQEPGMLGAIFFKAQNKIQDPAKLSRLVQLIDAESWISLDATPRATCTKACCRRTPKTPRAGPASISPRAR